MRTLNRIDGHNPPGKPCNDIVVRIQIAVDAILDLDVNVSGSLGPLIDEIVALLVKILNVRSFRSMPTPIPDDLFSRLGSHQLHNVALIGYYWRLRQIRPARSPPRARLTSRRRPRRSRRSVLPHLSWSPLPSS